MTFDLGGFTYTTGTFDLEDASLTIGNGTFVTTGGADDRIGDRTLTVLSSGAFTASKYVIVAGAFVNQGIVNGALDFGGPVSGSGSYTGPVTFEDSFSPGNSGPATVNLGSALFNIYSTLNMDIESPASMDRLNFAGGADIFGGTLNVTLGFTPSAGQSFHLFTGAFYGTFPSVDLPSLPSGLGWSTGQLYTNGILVVTQLNQWAAPVNGNYSDTGKWSDGYAPAVSDAAVFNTVGNTSYTVTFSSAAQVDHISIGNGRVALDLAGNDLSLTNKTSSVPAVQVGYTGTGSLTLENSGNRVTMRTFYVTVGQTADAEGSLTLDSSNVVWNNVVTMAIGGTTAGSGGMGVLNIEAGTITTSALKAWNTTGTAINLSGGTLSVGTLDLSGNPSMLNWTGGTLQITYSNATIGPTGTLPANLTLSPGMTLDTSEIGNLAVNTGSASAFTVNGASLLLPGRASNGTTDIGVFAIGDSAPGNVLTQNGTVISANFTNAFVGYNSAGTWTINGKSSFFSGGPLTVGSNAVGTMSILGGSVVSDGGGQIGVSTFSSGAISVDGAGSQWLNEGPLYDGYGGNGSLSVTNGGYVTMTTSFLGYSSDKVGSLTVNHSTLVGSDIATIGYYGSGVLTISNGGSATLAGADLGYIASDSSGTVNVSDAGSQLINNGDLVIGYGGYGELSIRGGATVSDVNVDIGFANSANGTASIDGAGSIWSSSGSMYVGGSSSLAGGYAAVSISGGMVTVGGTLKIWNSPNSIITNSVNLAGGMLSVGALDTDSAPENFVWTGGTLAITASDLHIGSAGLLGNSVTLSLGMNLQISSPSHYLTIDSDGILTNSGSIVATNMSILAGIYDSTGSTEIIGGIFAAGVQSVGGAFINHGAVSGPTMQGQYLTFTGDVTGSGIFIGNVAFAGSYRPADPVSVTFAGDVLFDSNDVLTMDIGGAIQGSEYDYLDFLKPAMLGGTLDIQLIDGFTPAVGDTFDLFGGPLEGKFAAVNLPALPSSLYWDTSRLNSNGLISVVPEPGLGWFALLLLPIFDRRLMRQIRNQRC